MNMFIDQESCQKRPSESGFTLIEVAIVVTILGLIIAPFFNFLSQNYKKDQIVKSEKRNERITAAIASYIVENNRYPCPANGALGPNSANFGVEARSGTTCQTTAANITLNNNIYHGTLPVHTLRLPITDAANNHGWKYLYAVTQNAVNDYGSVGQITVNVVDRLGATTPVSNVQFAIINPGKDGKGSTSLKGSANFISGLWECGTANADDADNCNTDGDFFDRPQRRLSSATHTDYYDDTLMFTLVRQESTFWELDNATNAAGRANMTMRGTGNLGIGVESELPSEKLHVRGGNIKIRSGADGTGTTTGNGKLHATGSVKAEGKVTAQEVQTNKASAVGGFFYDVSATHSE